MIQVRILSVCIAILTCCAYNPSCFDKQYTILSELTQSDCSDYEYGLPASVTPPHQTPGNCLNRAKVELGRRLFYEKDLSANQTQSCSTCHIQKNGFTDAKKTSTGSTGVVHPRNSQGLANVGYFNVFTWVRPDLNRLDSQALTPLLSQNTAITIAELNLFSQENLAIDRLHANEKYVELFKMAFGTDQIDIGQMTRALAAFQTTLVSFQSPYDLKTMNESAQRGEQVFRSEEAGCLNCHSGILFNQDKTTTKVGFHNIGLYNVGGTGDYPDQSIHGKIANRAIQGLFESTKNPSDKGKFRTPSLRNVGVTGPYMHDGSIATLKEVVEILNDGGRNVRTGPFQGDGRKNQNKSVYIKGLNLTSDQRADLVEFLKALTDVCFLTNPIHSDPNQPSPKQPDYCTMSESRN